MVETLAEPGQVVAAGQTVVKLAHAGPREAAVNLPETVRPASDRRRGPRCMVGGSAPSPAQLRQLSDAADPASRTYEARYVLDGEASLAPLGRDRHRLDRATRRNDRSGGSAAWARSTTTASPAASGSSIPHSSSVSLRAVQIRRLAEETAIVSGVAVRRARRGARRPSSPRRASVSASPMTGEPPNEPLQPLRAGGARAQPSRCSSSSRSPLPAPIAFLKLGRAEDPLLHHQGADRHRGVAGRHRAGDAGSRRRAAGETDAGAALVRPRRDDDAAGPRLHDADPQGQHAAGRRPRGVLPGAQETGRSRPATCRRACLAPSSTTSIPTSPSRSMP